MLQRLDELVTDRTRMVAMSHVSCESGTRLPATAISAWAAERGVLSMFDGAQSFGAIPVDVKAIGCDFYGANGHKWLCGPKGTGLLYGKLERLLELRPSHVGAGSLEKADEATGEAEPWSDGRRFEFGTRAWALYTGLDAVLDWFEGLGWDAVRAHMIELSGYLRGEILARPYLRLLTPRDWDSSAGITCLSLDGVDGGALGTALREKWRIHTRGVLRGAGVRISTACFNNKADIDTLLEGLDHLHAHGVG
jgi:selenocysteine lyase/cysteine desulfurase